MQKWIAKAVLQKFMSALPQSQQINYQFQKHITKNLPLQKDAFFQKVTDAVRHFNIFLQSDTLTPETTFYEFGAGWDLAIPLVYHALGVERQILVDIRPNVQWELVADTLMKILMYKNDISQIAGRPIRFTQKEIRNTKDLQTITGIDYRSPCDAAQTGLDAQSIDFISSTVTLEHIPESAIVPILQESYRILKNGGKMSSVIDMQDHFCYFDRSISYYNYLQFSDSQWQLIDSDLASQNRLRYPDYIRLIGQTPFRIVHEDAQRPTPEDLDNLSRLSVNSKFQTYTPQELGIRGIKIVLQKS
jgi:SAM-dependent methyltransferase